ncbi:MAG: class I SAM-dependent methyltransferase, partial [Woeseiaceae bacterium]|nr:class I SAM-dependent methyltransferase [Woeseiaceae bacterium]
CWLSQLTVVIDPRAMFSNYAYRSSISRRYKDHCRAMAKSVGASLGLGNGDLVVDIAGNDGALLAEFRDELGVSVVNVDPAENLAGIAESAGVPTITAFWGADVAARIVEQHGRPKLITATNVFAHVDDVRGFVAAARDCVDDAGALMLEFPYGVDFIEHREFDTIYHEHLSYVLIEPVRQLAESLGLEVFDVQKQDIHGGTVRVFIGKAGAHAVQASVAAFLDREKQAGYHDTALYEAWNRDIDELIGELRQEIGALCKDGKRVAAFAASAKGNTLLNACGFDTGTIEYIVDDTPEKIGRYSPGTGIPIVSRDTLAAEPPDYLVILAWNFAKDIIAGTADYAAAGGRYILPIPAFRVVDAQSGDKL